jgi:hypothetical protein
MKLNKLSKQIIKNEVCYRIKFAVPEYYDEWSLNVTEVKGTDLKKKIEEIYSSNTHSFVLSIKIIGSKQKACDNNT